MSNLIPFRHKLLSQLTMEGMYYTAALFSVVKSWKVTSDVPTAGIDTKLNIYINPKLLEDYDVFKMVALHEVSHIAHMTENDTMVPIEARKTLNTKSIKTMANIGMDISLNEHLKKIFGHDYEPTMKKLNVAINGEGATLETLDKMFKPMDENDKAKPDESARYYIDLIWKRWKKENPNGGECDGTGETMDSHDWDNLTEEEKESIRQAQKDAKSIGNSLAAKAGNEANDKPIDVQKVKIPKYIVNLFKKIETKIQRILNDYEEVDSYRRHRERGNLYLPTTFEVSGDAKSSTLIMVLDTSGSMFEVDVLSLSASLVYELLKLNKVGAVYCCDTELKRLKISTAFDVFNGLKGGGGTSLDNSHIATIREDLKLKDKTILDIVYVTDLEVDLAQIKANKFVRLHIVKNTEKTLSI